MISTSPNSLNLPKHRTRRVLVIDDTESIHDDFRMTLAPPKADASLALEAAAIFGDETPEALPSDAQDFVIDSAYQGEDGCKKVCHALAHGDPYAVAFVDMRMPPGWDGLETIERLWEVDPDLQIVICSAYSDYSWEDIIQRLGVNDQLLLLKKPFDTAEVSQLAVALTQKWELAQQAGMKFSELQGMVDRQTEALRQLAYCDKLTGLPNRAGLFEQLRPLVTESGDGFGLFFLDFDRFKLVNDSLGHDMGDELLIQITQRINQVLAQPDTIDVEDAPKPFASRLGGDEFVVVWPGCADHDWLDAKAQTLLSALRPAYTLGRHQVTSTASIGVTTSQIGYTRAEDAIRDADVAMYQAKNTGKDRACFFTMQMHDQAVERLGLEEGLAKALTQDELALFYQPIVDVQTGQTAGFEALIRWDRPGSGFVNPEYFISIAEETGQIIEIGQWVLDTAIQQHAQWRRQPGHEHLFMSINLSKRQLVDSSIAETIRDLLKKHDVPAQTIKVEITETAIMENPETVAPVLDELRALGVGLSMDDFGKGHSSLSCLHQFPLTTLKIDRLFIKNMEEHREYGAIIQAIIVLAKNLGIDVVAEGIETDAQLAQLQALDCDYAQGYFFSRPAPAHEVFEG
ncbi:MAG: EAL domain-containing protein [Planctomycetota bacterium]